MIYLIMLPFFILLFVLATSYVCFRIAFYVPDSKRENDDDYILPKGKIYDPHHETMFNWMKELRKIPYKEVKTTSYDGLTLYGKYYEKFPGAPIELMMHGYRGTAQRDLCGGVQRCFSLGRNALVIDQRGAGKSGGRVISFGINERCDCLSWVNYIIDNIDENAKIILTGISMGATTVMMATEFDLPENVIGVVADCGYTSAQEIIKTVIKQMKLPANFLYPFVWLGARIFGHFNPEETSADKALKKATVPVIIIHGDADTYVPCEMSHINYSACASSKKLLIVEGAGHGLSYLKNKDAYVNALKNIEELANVN